MINNINKGKVIIGIITLSLFLILFYPILTTEGRIKILIENQNMIVKDLEESYLLKEKVYGSGTIEVKTIKEEVIKANKELNILKKELEKYVNN